MSFVCVSSSQCRAAPTAAATVGRSSSRTARNATAAPNRPPRHPVSAALADASHQKLALRTRHQRNRSALVLCAAAEDETPPASGETPSAARAGANADDEEVKGAQTTAIVTGVISVVLAVGYLALVQLMDSREMLPPPPEAMGMGDVR